MKRVWGKKTRKSVLRFCIARHLLLKNGKKNKKRRFLYVLHAIQIGLKSISVCMRTDDKTQ